MVADKNLTPAEFQSRAGFSECLDLEAFGQWFDEQPSFNPVLGFLSVSTLII